MYEIVREDAIEIEADAIKAGPAHGKLAAKVVVGCRTRQGLGCADGIAEENAGERLEFALIERLFRGGVGLRGLVRICRYRDAFRQSGGVFVQRNYKIAILSVIERDGLLNESVAYGSDVKIQLARRQVFKSEFTSIVGICALTTTPGGLPARGPRVGTAGDYPHFRDLLARAGINHAA